MILCEIMMVVAELKILAWNPLYLEVSLYFNIFNSLQTDSV